MTWPTHWQHVRRITLYVLLMFTGFVILWLVLLAAVRSGGDNHPRLVTEVEIHSLQARWGVDVLAVPIIATVIMIARRRRREVGDVAIAFLVGLAAVVGMMYLPSAVMGGRVPWPMRTTHYFDTSGYLDTALAYATVVIVICVVLNRIAARASSPPTGVA